MQAPITISFAFNSAQDAADFMARAAGTVAVQAPANPTQPTTVAQPMPAVPGMPANTGAAPVAEAPSMPSAPQAPVAPVAATAASPSSHTVQSVQPLMQQFGQKFGAPTLKQAFTNKGLQPQLTALTPDQLGVMFDYLSRSIAANQLLAA